MTARCPVCGALRAVLVMRAHLYRVHGLTKPPDDPSAPAGRDA